MSYKSVFLFSVFLFLAPVALAETTGNISLGDLAVPPVTGLAGYIVQYCNSTADCYDYYCFIDYDGISSGTSQGWCNSSSVTGCFHDNASYASGYRFCSGNTSISCSSRSWSSVVCTYGCVNGTCQSSTTGTDGTTTYTSNVTTPGSSITIISFPEDFNITQGDSTTKPLTVKNNGEVGLADVMLEISGVDFYSVTPSIVTPLAIGSEAVFTISFDVPENATVKEYTVTVTVNTAGSASDSTSFKVKVLPSQETAESEIIPLYQEYLLAIQELENNITGLKNKGANITAIMELFNELKDKLNQTNSSLEGSDYFRANELLNYIGEHIEELRGMITNASVPGGFDMILVIVAVVIILAAGGVVAYLLLPMKKGFKPRVTSKEVENILGKIKEKKKYGYKK